jgi:hypothetical protein
VPTTPTGIVDYISGFADKVKVCQPKDDACKTHQAVVRYILAPYDEFIETPKDHDAVQEELRLRAYVDATVHHSTKGRARQDSKGFQLMVNDARA